MLSELKEAQDQGIPARPVIIGPITFLLLSKAVDGAGAPIERLDELVPLYSDLLGQLADKGVQWVQLDEPALVTDISADAPALAEAGLQRAGIAVSNRPAIYVATYFGDPGASLAALARTPVEAIGVDLVYGADTAIAAVPELADKTWWPAWSTGATSGAPTWSRRWASWPPCWVRRPRSRCRRRVRRCTCRTRWSPRPTWTTRCAAGWRSAQEKVAEVVTLARALHDGRDDGRRRDRGVQRRRGLAQDGPAPAQRPGPRSDRLDRRVRCAPWRCGRTPRQPGRAAASAAAADHDDRLVTRRPSTIRKARAALRAGEIDEAEYNHRMKQEIADVIKLQEQLGLDVLVHGEPERNDMVQYFAEQLEGFFATKNGWVQSYGSRCVRPPVLYGDVTRQHPMTVDWAKYAQSLTDKPVKGMLTGPVTILAWSFVRDDQPLADTANQVALAIRDETVDLQSAGIAVIQVDEPALRELLPLRRADQDDYLELGRRLVPLGYLRRRRLDPDPHPSVLLGVRRGYRGYRRPGCRRDLHRGGALAHGGAGRPELGRLLQQRGPGCLRHPLAAGAEHRRDGQVAAGRAESRSR